MTFEASFHGTALRTGVAKAPDCIACHTANRDPHQIEPLDIRSAENTCRKCHSLETKAYDISIHAEAAAKGKASAGCVSCHKMHSAALPPSVGAVNRLCESCHPGAMKQVSEGLHKDVDVNLGGVLNCASCHDVHSAHKPHLDQSTLRACVGCHHGYQEKFIGSVHEPLIDNGTMSCISCHRTHQAADALEAEKLGCGACHVEVEDAYLGSAHRLARLKGDLIAATCGGCHEKHHTLPASDPTSKVHRGNIPKTCGSCHGETSVITGDFVKLPISLPNYTASIHGTSNGGNHLTAVCTDCHGVHNLQSASVSTSTINKENLASTCGKCHLQVSREYAGSIHGRAVAHGIKDSPSCTDCHDEHLILAISDPKAAVNPTNQAMQTCGRCHMDVEMAARYGLPREVVESYEDSYHGWAVKRGGRAVAVCVDCHRTHDIRAPLDPASSVHKDNVVATCGQCHENSNAKFAASYTHLLARDKMLIHDWVRVIYIYLIIFVLGGMFVHNLIVFSHYFKQDYLKHKSEPAIRRWRRSEIFQHIILLSTFIGLAVTGFALRYPESWWGKLLAIIGFTEEQRRIVHRILAVMLIAASIYHIWFMFAARRGRTMLKAILPKFRDAKEAIQNIAFHLGISERRARFGMFDYTQKAEYWALIWGTALMSLTGLVLWFPTIATTWLPVWMVRVCEVIHFYEAILAISAIVIWHFFYVIFLPETYPMSWTWITGRMGLEEWERNHPGELEETGDAPQVEETMVETMNKLGTLE